MENAGAACARLLAERTLRRSRILVIAGAGNNGGDAYAAARHLHILGHRVRVLRLIRPGSDRPGARLQHRILLRMGITVRAMPSGRELSAEMRRADWIVDGLYGTGLSRPPSGRSAEAIRRMNASGRPVLAIDVPSGLDADTGSPVGSPDLAVRARLTATLAAPKQGLPKRRAQPYVGRLVTVDIGLPRELLG